MVLHVDSIVSLYKVYWSQSRSLYDTGVDCLYIRGGTLEFGSMLTIVEKGDDAVIDVVRDRLFSELFGQVSLPHGIERFIEI